MKTTKYFFLLFSLFNFNYGIGQNICTNGNFDTYTSPPNAYSQICFASGWLSPSGICALVAGTGSPDYYSTLGSGGAQAPATWWATVMPHSGVGMAGFATWYNSPNYREYIYRQLGSPMTIGQTYQVTFWVSNGVSWLHLVGTNNIGVNFSMSPLVQTLGNPILLTPQLETSGVIYDTGWKQVSFTYTATAAYQYVTIGNFHNDAATIHTSFGSGTYANYGCYYYIDDVVIQPATPLPVTLLSFSGENKNDVIHLEWSTATENNNAYFEIGKSLDGFEFNFLGTVAGNGNSTQQLNYEFDDKTPLHGINYYRLKQTDFNGHFQYSEIVAVNNKTEMKISLATSMVPGNLTLYFSIANNGIVTITDIRGKTINSILLDPEENELHIDLSKFAKGIYFISITDGEENKYLKVSNY